MINEGPLSYSSNFSIVVPMATVHNPFLRGTRLFYHSSDSVQFETRSGATPLPGRVLCVTLAALR